MEPRNRPERPERVRRPRRDDVRRQLLEAALDEFTRHGYDGVSLDEVAAAAGFSKGAIYSNFSNKEDLFLTLMDHQVRKRVEAVESTIAGVDQPPSGEATVDQVGVKLGALTVEDADWQLLYLDYVSRAARDADARQAFAERRRAVRSLIAAAAQDLLGPDHSIWESYTPDTVAVTVLALSNGLAIERIADPDGVPDHLFGQLLRTLQSTGND